MIIAVTGTPGTGKTKVAKELALLLSYKYVDLNKLAEEKGLVTGMDRERDSKIVDTEKFEELEIPENSVVDGHLSHFINANTIVVLRTRPDILKERLKKRNWPQKKVQENVEAEILGVCAFEAYETGQKVLEIDTSKMSAKEVAKTIKKAIDNNKDTKQIDWLEDYEDMMSR